MKKQVRGLIARPALQPFWERMLKLCHAGLNTGGGQWVGDSGEIEALRITWGRSTDPDPYVLFDVGANDGSYLEMAHKVIGQNLRVVAFEPQAASFSALQRKFGSQSWLTLHALALGKAESTAILYSQSDGDTLATLVPDSSLDSSADGGVQESVVVTSVDRICSEMGISHIDFLKIDTEGFELEVLLGAREMMSSGRIAAIQFEFGSNYLDTPYHFLDFWKVLTPNYAMHRILRHGIRELHQYSADLEIYKTANYLCLHR